MEEKKETKLFQRDFLLVVIGQIISLLGNQILRFALPLYLLEQTGSAALFGTVAAISFIPMIILCPIGGIVADRRNKKKIMVTLDFTTAALTGIFCIMLGKIDIVLLMIVTLAILYGIQGAYQPAVQASIPVLVAQQNIMPANAVINIVSSLSGLIGPVVGGVIYGFQGIFPILYVSIFCFTASAVMEIFIHIPFSKQKKQEGNVLRVGMRDMAESFHYIRKEKPSIWKVCLLMAAINLVISSLIMIGLPVVVTKSLGFSETTGNQLYGYAQGALAAGSLLGGVLAGILSKKLKAKCSPLLLLFCSIPLLPMGIALQLRFSQMAAYLIIVISCFIMMLFASLFSIQMMAYLQILTPEHLLGKVISCAMCISMCASPLGQLIYGNVFQAFMESMSVPFYVALAASLLIVFLSRKIFGEVASEVDG